MQCFGNGVPIAKLVVSDENDVGFLFPQMINFLGHCIDRENGNKNSTTHGMVNQIWATNIYYYALNGRSELHAVTYIVQYEKYINKYDRNYRSMQELR